MYDITCLPQSDWPDPGSVHALTPPAPWVCSPVLGPSSADSQDYAGHPGMWEERKSERIACLHTVSVKKKGNQDSILNFSKSKRQITKLLSVDDSTFIFLSYGILVVHIGSGMAAQQSFLKSMSKLSSSKFYHSTQCSADAWIVALLWKFRKCHHAVQTTPTWTK